MLCCLLSVALTEGPRGFRSSEEGRGGVYYGTLLRNPAMLGGFDCRNIRVSELYSSCYLVHPGRLTRFGYLPILCRLSSHFVHLLCFSPTALRPYLAFAPVPPSSSLAHPVADECRPTNERGEQRRNVRKGAERIWPQAQKLLDGLLAAEATASRHGIGGPAASSDAWPLDGPLVDFELTSANEDAYYMHVAIRRAAAAVRTRAEEEEREQEEEERDRERKRRAGASAAAGAGTAASAAREARVAAAVRAAVSVASSPAMLYTRQEMGDEEGVLRECLSVFRSDRAEKALRWEQDEGMRGLGGGGSGWAADKKTACAVLWLRRTNTWCIPCVGCDWSVWLHRGFVVLFTVCHTYHACGRKFSCV